MSSCGLLRGRRRDGRKSSEPERWWCADPRALHRQNDSGQTSMSDPFATVMSMQREQVRQRKRERKRIEREEMRRSRQPSLPVGIAVSFEWRREVEPDDEAQMCARRELGSSCLDATQNLRDAPYWPRLVCRPHRG